MKQVLLILISLLLFTAAFNAQSVQPQADGDELAADKSALFSDIQALDLQAAKLETPLARALAKADVADAAWLLDQTWAKKVLREAYQLTFPEEPAKPQGVTDSAPPANDRASNEVRNRIIAIASRDKAFADELTKLGAEKLGTAEKSVRDAGLAAAALKVGDRETAGKYILQAIDADPTQLAAPFQIVALAAQDRAAADKLIVQYIERLSALPPSGSGQTMPRISFLASLVFPPSNPKAASPGAAVMRAYVVYVIETLRKMEEVEPGSLQRARGILMTAWVPLQQYAPELAGAFLELERLSDVPGESAALPMQKIAETSKANYEKSVKDELDSGRVDQFTVLSAISRGDFDIARKLIDKLGDGPQKMQLVESVNAKEALSLASKGDTVRAEGLAKQLKKATSILNVYPTIIEKCAANKDQACATNLTYQALRQLKDADITPPAPPAGVPTSLLPTGKEFDPVLATLNKLAKAIAPVNDTLALEVLDEIVQAANRSELDTKRGLTGLETDVFITLASKHELRVRQAAGELKDPLRQIVTLAAADRWKAEQLTKKTKPSSYRRVTSDKLETAYLHSSLL